MSSKDVSVTLRFTALEGTYYGKTATLECEFDNTVVETFKFTKDDGKENSTDMEVFDLKSNTLTMDSLSIKDDGIYKCFVFSPTSVPLESETASIFVIPVLTIVNTSESGDFLTFSCKITHEDTVNYKYTYILHEGNQSMSFFGGHIDIIIMTPITAGEKNYSCIVDILGEKYRDKTSNRRESNNTIINIQKIKDCESESDTKSTSSDCVSRHTHHAHCLHEHCWCTDDDHVYDRCSRCCTHKSGLDKLDEDTGGSAIAPLHWVLIGVSILAFFILCYMYMRPKHKKKKKHRRGGIGDRPELISTDPSPKMGVFRKCFNPKPKPKPVSTLTPTLSDSDVESSDSDMQSEEEEEKEVEEEEEEQNSSESSTSLTSVTFDDQYESSESAV